MYNILMKTVNLRPEYDQNGVRLFNSIHLQPCRGILAEVHTEEFPPKHHHDFYEVIFCLEGTQKHFYSEHYSPDVEPEYSTHLFEKDCILIIPPRCVHYFKLLSPTVKLLNFHVEQQKFNELIDALNLQALQGEVTFRKIHSSVFPFEEFFYNIYSTSTYSVDDRTVLNFTLLTNLLSCLVLKKTAKPNWLSVLLSQLNTPSNYDKSLQEIVRDSEYSYSQLSKLFKKEMQESIIDYFIESKMKYAVTLLDNPDLKIIDISFMLGYDNCSFFSKTFKKQFGLSPKEYRRKHLVAKKTK